MLYVIVSIPKSEGSLVRRFDVNTKDFVSNGFNAIIEKHTPLHSFTFMIFIGLVCMNT